MRTLLDTHRANYEAALQRNPHLPGGTTEADISGPAETPAEPEAPTPTDQDFNDFLDREGLQLVSDAVEEWDEAEGGSMDEADRATGARMRRAWEAWWKARREKKARGK